MKLLSSIHLVYIKANQTKGKASDYIVCLLHLGLNSQISEN